MNAETRDLGVKTRYRKIDDTAIDVRELGTAIGVFLNKLSTQMETSDAN